MRGVQPCTTMFDVLQAGTVSQFYALVMFLPTPCKFSVSSLNALSFCFSSCDLWHVRPAARLVGAVYGAVMIMQHKAELYMCTADDWEGTLRAKADFCFHWS